VNLGTGDGTSVNELVKAIEDVTGHHLATEFTRRRDGDSPMLVADSSKAAIILDWTPRHDLISIIKTAWNWHAHTNVA
jgi:UDP-glucose 4-epimerase